MLDFEHVDRHETIDGFPFVHLLRTEHAFLERKVQFDFSGIDGADGGAADELQFETEFFWALHSRLGVLLEVPAVSLDPAVDPNTAGFGDIEAGIQILAYNGLRSIVAFGLNLAMPTGDDDRDLGAGHTSLEPKGYVLRDLGTGWLLQGEFAVNVPLDVSEPANELGYNIGLSKAIRARWAGRGQYVAPLLEFNGTTVLNGNDSGATVIDLTAGVRWFVGENDQIGLGWSVPISHRENFDDALILSYVLHF